MGETALKLLKEEASNSGMKPRKVVFQPELIVRSST
jgi:DNA-binding LacI/PurR family transcriptional regulator